MVSQPQHNARLGSSASAEASRREPPGQQVPSILALAFAVFLLIGGFAVGLFSNLQSAAGGSDKAAANVASASAPSLMPGTTGSVVSNVDIAKKATELPAPITRTTPTTVNYTLTTTELKANLADGTTYAYWTFDNTVPGPFLRVMQGDTVSITIKNAIGSTMPHSIDLHAVSGPGGGSVATQTQTGKDTTFSFKALNPGLYIYHCATAPATLHIVNGMFGMILVEPPGGLPKVDREFYIMQSEIYTDSALGTKGEVKFSNNKLLAEQPTYYIFNGRVGSLMKEGALHVKTGESVRIYFGVGTFKAANFHVIGAIFDTVYSDGGIGGATQRNVGVVIVPAGGTTMVDLTFKVPGTYVIVDHALQRTTEGAAGQIVVEGPANPDVFNGTTSGPVVH